MSEDTFRFAPSVEGGPSQHEDPRLALMAVCVRQQAAAGFRNLIDIRQAACPECGAPGFNTGWGIFAYTCGAETLTDEDGGFAEPCGAASETGR